MASGAASEAALSFVWFILGHRSFLFLLNLVVGSAFLSLILSIPWLRRHGISFGWFRLLVREERVDHVQFELRTWRSSFRRLSRTSRTSILLILPEGTTSLQTNTQPCDLEMNQQSPTQSCVTPFLGATSDARLSRNSSASSKYSSATTDQSQHGGQRLEPLRRSVGSDIRGIGAVWQDTGEPSIAYAETTATPSLLQPPSPSPSSDADLSDMRMPETPTSSATERFGVDVPETPRRYRPPTYGSVFSGQSIVTLPVYRENEEDRLSIVSQAPTYRSTVTILSPRSPLRSARPPLPVPPSGFLLNMVRRTP
ncbi:hypothetical protein P691DRAFT_493503 [Macrolepiota fuliginosa MF-IS2]|uniref:Uncharacterized protein n=1 Tax=Macrolepiota fuliginosa MF-IS2 TaxID=1400762 RepID=A0A9P6C327_9AGAR|nr:hypothetical protein P691DRAFT_493503 [Macrolepiota fuliginosa MF-IS2]